MDPFLFDYMILPTLILLARIVDVSMDTLRLNLVAKGYRNYAPIIGFFQSLVWVITISRVMVNLENWTAYAAYASGFALGTYVGMRIEEKLALGYELIRIVTRTDATELVTHLRDLGFAVTSVIGEGRDGEVGILFVVLKRKTVSEVVEIIKSHNPKAFYTIEDMRFVSNAAYLPRSRKVIPSRANAR